MRSAPPGVSLHLRATAKFSEPYLRFPLARQAPYPGSACRHQDKQRRTAGLHFFRQLLHEFVIDADIRERAGNRSCGGADCHAEKRIQKEHPDQRPPKAAAQRPRRRNMHRLMELTPSPSAP